MLKIESPKDKSYFDAVEVSNLTGKILKELEAKDGQELYDFQLPRGIYIIRLKLKGQVIRTEKILFGKG